MRLLKAPLRRPAARSSSSRANRPNTAVAQQQSGEEAFCRGRSQVRTREELSNEESVKRTHGAALGLPAAARKGHRGRGSPATTGAPLAPRFGKPCPGPRASNRAGPGRGGREGSGAPSVRHRDRWGRLTVTTRPVCLPPKQARSGQPALEQAAAQTQGPHMAALGLTRALGGGRN
ncbi:hypothetical protein AAFF_G00393540 [Aldrovandia affinis]|uniref:Uncharacterized protein n=1 Tax=Aldrovandia affinis TaxID=143900 RepID=A0AAD7SDJ2_9TELE|nr:hypothetical protein AAFF_G00393540 [Aldrovandia affinis]